MRKFIDIIAAASAIALSISVNNAARADEFNAIDHCGSQAFHGQHEACLDYEIRRLFPEQREHWAKVLKIKRQTMALLDHQGEDVPPEREQLNKLENCGGDDFRREHEACFSRELAKLSSDYRQRLGAELRKLKVVFAELDRSERLLPW